VSDERKRVFVPLLDSSSSRRYSARILTGHYPAWDWCRPERRGLVDIRADNRRIFSMAVEHCHETEAGARAELLRAVRNEMGELEDLLSSLRTLEIRVAGGEELP